MQSKLGGDGLYAYPPSHSPHLPHLEVVHESEVYPAHYHLALV
jgi:hypothetical protein